jgi:hypothetical protein
VIQLRVAIRVQRSWRFLPRPIYSLLVLQLHQRHSGSKPENSIGHRRVVGPRISHGGTREKAVARMGDHRSSHAGSLRRGTDTPPPPPLALNITSAASISGTVGVNYPGFMPAASDSMPPYNWSWAASPGSIRTPMARLAAWRSQLSGRYQIPGLPTNRFR